MTWNRHTSRIEDLVIEILKEAKRPLSMGELVERIIRKEPKLLNGKTPENSLYSILYRREKRRNSRGHERLFVTIRGDGKIQYKLNEKAFSK